MVSKIDRAWNERGRQCVRAGGKITVRKGKVVAMWMFWVRECPECKNEIVVRCAPCGQAGQ
jgi:predicted RNA-binding Zn-ribbon protein involved in translation (DUF1610 family)